MVADTGEIWAMKEYKPIDATTNPRCARRSRRLGRRTLHAAPCSLELKKELLGLKCCSAGRFREMQEPQRTISVQAAAAQQTAAARAPHRLSVACGPFRLAAWCSRRCRTLSLYTQWLDRSSNHTATPPPPPRRLLAAWCSRRCRTPSTAASWTMPSTRSGAAASLRASGV